MRTTVDIPDSTYRELKAKAAKRGCSVKELILESVRSELRPRARRKGRIELPLVHSKEPGTLRLTNEQIYEIIPFP
jgi:hypothetical protein